jgi:hypothetical protein
VAGDARFLTRVKQARMSLDLACILRWDRLAAAGDVPFTKQQLVTRYRDTYTAAVRSRALPKRHDALLSALSDFLKWYTVMKPLKPLPPPLDAIPAQHVRQLTPETAKLHGKAPQIVEDPAAASGIAVAMVPSLTKPSYAPAGLPANVLNMGFYDQVTRRQQHAHAGKDDPIKSGEYRLYPIGRTVLSSQCYVWFDWSWFVQFHDVSGLYNPDEAGKQWDVFASIRFEGPAYSPQTPAKQNRFYVDRVVFVAAER